MKNMPSVMKEMPNGMTRLIRGKKMQKDRPLTSVSGLDVISSTVLPISPVAFNRLFQDSLRVHNQAGMHSASVSIDGQDQGIAAGKSQLPPPDGEQGLLPLTHAKNRFEKGILISAPGVKGKTGKKSSVEGFLNANPNVAVSSQTIPMADNNGEPASHLPQETTESRGRLQNASGKPHAHLRSVLRHTGEYSAVPGEKGGPSKDAAVAETDGDAKMGQVGDVDDRSGKRAQTAPGVKTSPSLDASEVGAVTTVPLSLGSENGSGVLSPEPPQHASGKTHDHLRSVLRQAGEYSAVPREKSGPSNNAAIVETGGNVKMGYVDDVDDATRRRQSVETINDQENRGPADDSPLRDGSGERAQTAPVVKTSSLLNTSVIGAVNASPPSLGSVNGSGVLSPGREQHVSEKIDNFIRSGHRYANEYSAFLEEKGESIKNTAVVETDGNAKMVMPDDSGDVTRSVHSADTRYDSENKSHANDSPFLSLLREDSGKRAQAVPASKTSLLSTATAVPAADASLISVGSDNEKGILSAGLLHNVSEKMQNHVRSGRRHTDNYSAVPGEKGGPGKNAAIHEMEENAKAVRADDVDAATPGVHGADTGRNEENNGRTDGSPLLSLFKENLGEHLRRAVVGEKASFLSAASVVPAVDVASISGGSDNGEGMLSPGRQALLIAEVLDTARPLVQQGGGRVRISLTPPNLGALEIEVRVKKEGVELFVVANNSDVRQTLCSHVDQLRKALVEQGLNMDRFQVVVGDRSDGQQGRDPQQEGMSGGHREAWSEKAYLPGLDGDATNDEMGKSARSGSYPSVGAINLFI